MNELEEVRKEVNRWLTKYYIYTRKEGRVPYDMGYIDALRRVVNFIREKEKGNG